MKKCSKCGLIKLESEFNKNPALRDGLDSRCKVCKYKRASELRVLNNKREGIEYPKTKTCPACGQIKDAADFYSEKGSNDGLSSKCAECNRVEHKKRYDSLEDKTDRERPPSKYCPECQRILPASEFWKVKKRYDGLYPYCKACFKVRNSVYRLHAEALLNPDHTCMHPGCNAAESHGKNKALHFHEINGRQEGSKDNWWRKMSRDQPEEFKATTLLLCRKHHDEYHSELHRKHREVVAETSRLEELENKQQQRAHIRFSKIMKSILANP